MYDKIRRLLFVTGLSATFLCLQSPVAGATTLLRETINYSPVSGGGYVSVLGLDDALGETISSSGTFTNSSDSSGGSWTATATTAGGATPKAVVGGEVTNQFGPVSDPGKIRQVRARTAYDFSIFSSGAIPLPAGVLVPIVVSAQGSASVGIPDPSLAFFGVSGSLQLTLPNPLAGNAPSNSFTTVANAYVSCGGFSFCFNSVLAGFSDTFSYSDTLFYADGSHVYLQLLAQMIDPVTGAQTVTFDAMADPLIYIDPIATFEDAVGNQVLFTDAFDLYFSAGILPGTPGGGEEGKLPEPTTLAIFGLGLAGLGFMRRRSRKRAAVAVPVNRKLSWEGQ